MSSHATNLYVTEYLCIACFSLINIMYGLSLWKHSMNIPSISIIQPVLRMTCYNGVREVTVDNPLSVLQVHRIEAHSTQYHSMMSCV